MFNNDFKVLLWFDFGFQSECDYILNFKLCFELGLKLKIYGYNFLIQIIFTSLKYNLDWKIE